MSGWRPWLLNQRASLAELVVAAALQTGHQHHRRRTTGVGDLQRLATEHCRQLVVDDLDDLLAGVEGLTELCANGLFADAGGDVADDAEVDVGLEQRRTDLFEHLVDVGFGQPTFATDLLDNAFKASGQRVKHRSRDYRRARSPSAFDPCGPYAVPEESNAAGITESR
jgi:hypothetical protein